VLVQHFIDKKKYPHCEDEHLEWQFRWNLFQKMLVKWDADVVCLQEVEEDGFKAFWLNKFVDMGYEAHYQKKPSWGNVIAFRTNKFSLEWLDSRSRVLIACLRMIENDHLIYVANVHLTSFYEKTEEKMNQSMSLVKQMEKHQLSRNLSADNFSTIVCGDFNSSPTGGIYKLFTEGCLRADYRDAHNLVYTKADFKIASPMKSAYFEKFGREPEWTVTVQDHNFVDTLDFIFYSPQKIELVNCEEVRSSKMSKIMPNDVNPSDHLPVVAEFKVLVSPVRRLLLESS
jgi:mRNA deadenylase 3'-5' endonuclease subunit Ccr4